MKIVIINHSDTRGGASVVTRRLAHAMADRGIDVTMLTVHRDDETDPLTALAAPAWKSKIPFYAEAAEIFSHNGFNRKDLFKVSTGRYGLPLSKHPEIVEADCVILAWVNQGMLSLSEIERIARGKRVVWVMHDMWNLTALCHHAGDCRRYSEAQGCNRCPFLHSRASDHDLSAKVWHAKKELYSRADIDFVAVSSWLAERCRNSTLFDGRKLHVIPNVFPTDEFYCTPRRSRDFCGLPQNGKIILMGAARLDDPVKGLHLAVDALNRLEQLDAPEATAVFFGSLRDRQALDDLKYPHLWLGPIQDSEVLHELYAHASVVLSSSLYETLPGTLIEGQASGAVPVCFDRGGQKDIIRQPGEGYIVPFGDTDAMAQAIAKALGDSDTEHLVAAAHRFAPENVVDKFLEICR